ncbi:hypothetical protein [Paraburkholderia caribensis]|uniref:AbiU2 domain-containing protein n=1 Tax=Paraburkholderia caribensis TaxID=75105 RepID=UPI001CB0F4BF|nr:hypothetical protein [Paraburkholderia caribensis]CAG9269878.1 HEPN_AbiU2 domain-containing protein [Paraburkholderia caribensis]
MPAQTEKLQAYAGHLLDAFIALRERYAMLEPMLFDPATAKTLGSGKRSRGFFILRQSLFLSCAQDVAKLILDTDKRTPSIRNIVSALEDDALRAMFEDEYANWVVPSIEEEDDPEIVAALRRFEEQERLGKREQFREHYLEMRGIWETLSSSPAVEAFRTVRDKISAHTEIRLVIDKYNRINIDDLGIKWDDLRAIIEQMQRIVELIGYTIRNASFAWESLDHQLVRAASDFWDATITEE